MKFTKAQKIQFEIDRTEKEIEEIANKLSSLEILHGKLSDKAIMLRRQQEAQLSFTFEKE